MADIAKVADRTGSKRIGSLRSLIPFFRPHLVMVFAAMTALVLTAFVSLVLPLAVRRVVDGFQTGETQLLDQYQLYDLNFPLFLYHVPLQLLCFLNLSIF